MNPELAVLHGVRLAGFAPTQAVAERTGLGAADTQRLAEKLERAGLVGRFTFAGDTGWTLTDAGRERDTVGVQAEVAAAGAAGVLELAADRFDEVNGRFVQAVTAWQLRPDDAHVDELVETLAGIVGEVVELLAPVVVLPWFDRYPRQLRRAIERAKGGELEWLAGVGHLSAHTVWAELHQDLLTALGRERGA